MATDSFTSPAPDVESVTPEDIDSGCKRWHPKISPYRLWIIATTIGFGTTKSISAGTGNSFIPTTLEWLAGTVFFLIFFSVSSYDADNKPTPKCLSWLFEPDCMDVFWFLLDQTLAVKRPKYSSKEVGHPSRAKSHHPALSHYRLLVILTVASFGMSKAQLAYSGQSAAMNWTDWALAVPVTTIFYVLGLYEYNELRVGSFFFVADRKFGLSVGIKFTLGMIFSIAWSIGSIAALIYTVKHPEWITEHPSSRPPAATPFRPFIDFMFYYSVRAFSYWMLVGQVGLGFTLSTLTLNYLAESMEIEGNPVHTMWKKARRVSVRKIAPIIKSLSMSFEEFGGFSWPIVTRFYGRLHGTRILIRQAMSTLLHIFVHLVLVVGLFMMIGIMLGVVTSMYDMRSQKLGFWNVLLSLILLSPLAFSILFFIGMVVAVLYVMISRQT